MNRLCVAASRAKSRLIIVDDDAGIAYLWDNAHLKSMENLLHIYQPASRHAWQAETVNYVQRGVAENWRQDRDDPLELAHSFRQAGLLERDAYKLLLAEHNYLRCGQNLINNANLCRAERLEIEKKFSEAGKQYLELDQTESAG